MRHNQVGDRRSPPDEKINQTQQSFSEVSSMIWSPKSKILLIAATLLVLNGNWFITHRATLLLIGAIFLAARNGWIKTSKSKVVLVAATLLFVGGAQMISASKKDEPVYPTRINTGTWAQTFNSRKPLPNYNYQDDYQDDYGGFDVYCDGDCYDMDNDGRTWNDVDADGDGLYETP